MSYHFDRFSIGLFFRYLRFYLRFHLRSYRRLNQQTSKAEKILHRCKSARLIFVFEASCFFICSFFVYKFWVVLIFGRVFGFFGSIETWNIDQNTIKAKTKRQSTINDQRNQQLSKQNKENPNLNGISEISTEIVSVDSRWWFTHSNFVWQKNKFFMFIRWL